MTKRITAVEIRDPDNENAVGNWARALTAVLQLRVVQEVRSRGKEEKRIDAVGAGTNASHVVDRGLRIGGKDLEGHDERHKRRVIFSHVVFFFIYSIIIIYSFFFVDGRLLVVIAIFFFLGLFVYFSCLFILGIVDCLNS